LGVDNALWINEDAVDDQADHGTSVACVAGGLQSGVAPNADLYLIKSSGLRKESSLPGAKTIPVGGSAALISAIGKVFTELRNNPRPAVLSYSLSELSIPFVW
jgi:hypothetical protein